MTCIVGVEHGGKVYLGCDSAQSDGHFISSIDCPKIFTNGDITIGYTTSFRFADILQYSFKTPFRTEDVTDDRQYLVNNVVKEMRASLKEHGFAQVKDNKEEGGTALLVYKGKLYLLQDDFSIVRDSAGYATCGSGCNFAKGSLATTQELVERDHPENRVRLALEAAIKHCATVQGPIIIRVI